jgi:hypothetical protein
LSKIFQILENNTEACIESDDFLTCLRSSLLHLLSKDKLNIKSELQLIMAAIRWCQRQSSGMVLDHERAQMLLGPCLQELRFLALSPGDFSAHVANSGLLSKDDVLAVLINISSPGQSPLPECVSPNREPRKIPPHLAGGSGPAEGQPQKGRTPTFKKAPNANKTTPKKQSPEKVHKENLKSMAKLSISNSKLSEGVDKCEINILTVSSSQNVFNNSCHTKFSATFSLTKAWCFSGIKLCLTKQRPAVGKVPFMRQLSIKVVEVSMMQSLAAQSKTVDLTKGLEDFEAPVEFLHPAFLDEKKTYELEVHVLVLAPYKCNVTFKSLQPRGGLMSALVALSISQA